MITLGNLLRGLLGRGRQEGAAYCKRFGHDIPKTIDGSHPSIDEDWRSRDGRSSRGIAYPITCARCGHEVQPMDDGYPMITLNELVPPAAPGPGPPEPPRPPRHRSYS